MGRAITPFSSFPPSAVNTWSGPEVQTMMLSADPETEPVAVQEQLLSEDEAVLEEKTAVVEELDLPTSEVPGAEALEEDVSEEEVLGEDVSEEDVVGEDASGDELPGEEVDDLVDEEEPAPAQEQSPPDPDLADDDEQSSTAPTDEANDPGTEAND